MSVDVSSSSVNALAIVHILEDVYLVCTAWNAVNTNKSCINEADN